MSWILVGYIASTLIAQSFDTREACEGRAVVLREAKALVKCVEAPLQVGVTSYGTICTNCILGH